MIPFPEAYGGFCDGIHCGAAMLLGFCNGILCAGAMLGEIWITFRTGA